MLAAPKATEQADAVAEQACFVAALLAPGLAKPVCEDAIAEGVLLYEQLGGSDAHVHSTLAAAAPHSAAPAAYTADGNAPHHAAKQLESMSVASQSTLTPAWAPGLSAAMREALAACAQHQLRSANVSTSGCTLHRCAALLRLLAVCAAAAPAGLSATAWQRGLRVVQDHISSIVLAAEDTTEQLCSAAAALAASVKGAPRSMDASFAVTFLSRLASKNVVPAGARQKFIHAAAAIAPAGAADGAFQLLAALRAAGAQDPERFSASAQQLAGRFAEVDALLLRLVLCAGACLSVADTAAMQPQVLGTLMAAPAPFWPLVAHSVAASAHDKALQDAVAEFDAWSQDLGVATYDAFAGLLACGGAPPGLRALAARCVVQAPLLERTAYGADEDMCATASDGLCYCFQTSQIMQTGARLF